MNSIVASDGGLVGESEWLAIFLGKKEKMFQKAVQASDRVATDRHSLQNKEIFSDLG